jgi:hypothetical protein
VQRRSEHNAGSDGATHTEVFFPGEKVNSCDPSMLPLRNCANHLSMLSSNGRKSTAPADGGSVGEPAGARNLSSAAAWRGLATVLLLKVLALTGDIAAPLAAKMACANTAAHLATTLDV